MSKHLSNALAVMAMVLVFCGLTLLYWAGEQRNLAYGPTQIIEDSNKQVWILADRELLTLDAEGNLHGAVSLESLAVDEEVNALSAFEGGSLLLGSYATQQLYVLNPDSKQAVVLPTDLASVGGLPHGFALDYDAMRQRILIAHTGHHRLLILDGKGRFVTQAGSIDGRPGEFHFPNEIKPARNGYYYVSDTNHHQIQILDDRLRPVEAPVPIRDLEGARWPVSVAPFMDGRLLVTVLYDGMRKGQAALYSTQGETVQPLQLPNGAEPTSVVIRKQDILLADNNASRYQIHRYNHDGKPLGQFGDVRFQARLDDAAERYRNYGALRLSGQALTVVAALALLLIYSIARRTELKHSERNIQLPDPPKVSWYLWTEMLLLVLAGPVLVLISMEVLGSYELPADVMLIGMTGLVVIMMLSLIVVMRVVQSPRYQALYRAQIYRGLKAKLKRFNQWMPQEEVIAYAAVIQGMNALYLLLTSERLILMPMRGLFDARVKDELPLNEIRRLEIGPAKGGWRWVLGRKLKSMQIFRKEMQERSWQLNFQRPGEAEAFQAHLEERMASAPPRTAPISAASAETRPPVSRPVWASLGLSLLLPGLGHLNQRRHEKGLYFLLLCGALVAATGLAAYAHYARVSQVDLSTLYGLYALLGMYWLWALVDVWRFRPGRPVNEKRRQSAFAAEEEK